MAYGLKASSCDLLIEIERKRYNLFKSYLIALSAFIYLMFRDDMDDVIRPSELHFST